MDGWMDGWMNILSSSLSSRTASVLFLLLWCCALARSLACVFVLLRTHPLLLCIMASVQGVLLNVSAISSSSTCIAPVAQQSRVARFNGLRVTPVFKQGPTSSLALRMFASRRCHPRHISAAAAPETLEVVTEVIAGQLAIDVAQVQAESKFTDLGADSLDTVEIMMALEEKFDIQLDEDNAEKIVTVQHAADLIHDVVAAKKA